MDQAREIAERYHLGGEIGSTRGMRSLRAIDRATGEAVVFELVPRRVWAGDDGAADAADVGARFGVAAALLAAVQHPSLPAVLDHGIDAEGGLYLVREATVDHGIDALAGEPPAEILTLLVGIVEALDLLSVHGFHHGALSGETVRVAQEVGGSHGLLVGLAQGLAETVVTDRPDPAARRRDDLRSFAALVCRLLGGTVRDPGAAAPGVKLPLGVSFELEDAESVRLALESCLRRDDEPLADYGELRAALCRAIWGVPRVPEGARGALGGATAVPPARLTYSTIPPDEGLLARGAASEAAAVPPTSSAATAEGAGAAARSDVAAALEEAAGPDEAAVADGVTEVILEQELARRPEDTAPGLTPAVPGPDDTAPGLDDTAPGPDGIVTGLEDTSPDLERTLGRLGAGGPPAVAGGTEPTPESPPEVDSGPGVEGPPEWIAAAPEWVEEPPELRAGLAGPAVPPEASVAASGLESALVPKVPPQEPFPAEGAAAEEASAVPATPPVVARPGRRRLLVFAGAVAALVLVAAVAAVLVVLGARFRRPPAVPVPPSPVASPPAETATSPPAAVSLPTFARHRKLLEAKVLLVNGDDVGAAAALASLPPEEEASFTPADCELAAWLAASLGASRDERLAADLDRALAGGDLERLRRTVTAGEAAGTPFVGRYPEAVDGLARARRALALDAEARRAFAGGDYPLAIETAGRLLAVLPGSPAAGTLRERAAAEIEAGAEAAFAGGRYEEALDRLAPLAQVWPDRSELDERRERYRARLRAVRDLDAVLASAAEAGERGEPDAGLALLDGVTEGDGAARVAAARRRLEERLADLDRQPPRIELAPESAAEIAKDASAAIVVRVSDDFRVVRVAIFARAEGGAFVELPVDRSGGVATAEVGPDLHGNKEVDFYVTAADLSGHTASLGSAAEPLQIKRRRWIRRIFGG